LRILANENIPVEYVYAFVAGDKDNLAYVVLRLENNEAASKVLESHGIALLEQSDIV
jgi:hypothetical protein